MNLCASRRALRKSLSVIGRLLVSPRCIEAITLNPLHFKISFSDLTTPDDWWNNLFQGQRVVQVATIAAFLPRCRGMGMPLDDFPIIP